MAHLIPALLHSAAGIRSAALFSDGQFRAPANRDAFLAATAARVAACDAYYFASKENIQAHGGMGYTWEVDCHLFYRRAKLLAVQCGGPGVWKEKLVRRLELKNAA